MFKRKPQPKTYETITAGLQQLVQDLHNHADEHEDLSRFHAEEANFHGLASDAASDTAAKSRKTAEKVAALLD